MVEWKKLGDIAHYYRGVTYNKKQEVSLNSGGTKIFRANNINIENNSLNYDDIKEISKEVKIKDYQWLNKDDILICAGSGSKDHVGKVAFIKEKMDFSYGGFMGKIVTDELLLPRYLFHVISGLMFKKYLEVALNSTTINNLNSEIVNNFEIPIPPLSEQQRIVGILDTFTTSIDNLKEQIAQRRKQYEYYRDQLLDLEGKPGVEMKTVGEIALKISSGKNKTKNETGLYPVFGSTGIIAYTDDYVFDKPLILVARVGANAGFVHMSYGKYDITDNTLYVELSPNVNQKYILYLLVKENINKYAKGGGQPLITASILKDIIIPLPSLAEQQRIVGILDTFEASIQNLEAQLKEREKQYEYYRNKLLTFE